jgi:hypothetical protein
MILVHASPTTLEPYRHKNLGALSSPRRWYRASEGIEGWTWAADNDAYSSWSADRFRRMLEGIWGLRGCLFVTAPDVVGDADRTLESFEEWYDELNAVLQPLAFVLQDGLTPDRVPWQRIDAVFIGGSSEWKFSDTVREIVREAHLREKWVHMGRVNSHQRVRYAKAIGCDSMDGMKFSWFRDTYLRDGLHHAAAPAQGMLT